MQQVANLRRLGCAGAVSLRRVELCAQNIRAKMCVFSLQFHPPTLSGSNFPYTKNRAGAGVWIVATQRSFGRDLILGTQRVLRGARSDFLYTKKRSAARPRCDFLYTKNRRIIKKNQCYIENFSALRAHIC